MTIFTFRYSVSFAFVVIVSVVNLAQCMLQARRGGRRRRLRQRPVRAAVPAHGPVSSSPCTALAHTYRQVTAHITTVCQPSTYCYT